MRLFSRAGAVGYTMLPSTQATPSEARIWAYDDGSRMIFGQVSVFSGTNRRRVEFRSRWL
jgi:hypothetical protein